MHFLPIFVVLFLQSILLDNAAAMPLQNDSKLDFPHSAGDIESSPDILDSIQDSRTSEEPSRVKRASGLQLPKGLEDFKNSG